MPRIEYVPKNFSEPHMRVIERANEICEQYAAQGYDLTLRQLYYQFVSRGLIPNRQQEYKRLGDIIGQARLAGLLDWDYINDRTRNLRELAHWSSPNDILSAVARQYRERMWENQRHHIEVWIEKDALIGVIEGVCNGLDLPHFSCRGYTSISEVWSAARRLERAIEAGQECLIVHLGDHDPSGIDMSRDIEARLRLFIEGDGFEADMLTVDRVALNFDQVARYNPPPNPAKLTDSRAVGYIERHGDESWELDALEPTVIGDLIRDTVEPYIDRARWEEDEAKIESERRYLASIAGNYRAIVAFMGERGMIR
jgi:hypothetical protein